MLRKNNLDRIKQEGRCTVSCQTQQFLLYLALEDKLENVYKEYRELQKKYTETQRLAQLLQDKNKYLETSLFDISITYNNKIANSNIRRIQEIRNLEERITKETKQLEFIHQNDGIKTHNTQKSLLQEEKSKLVQQKSMQAQSCIKCIRIPAQAQSSNEFQEFSLSGSNQFLPQAILDEKKQTRNQSDRCEDHYKLLIYDQPSTFRPTKKSKRCKSSSKKRQADKENINYDKLAKIQAHLKLKQFMQKFQMDSENYEQFPSYDQLSLLQQPIQSSISKLR